MALTPLTRRRLLAAAGAGVLTMAVAACGGGSLGGDNGSSGGGGKADTIKVGLVIPQAGVYTPLGVDMKNGWDLWLKQHGNKLGGYEVETVVADEGEGPDTGVPAVQRLLQQENVDVVVGIVNSAVALGAAPMFNESKKVLLVANAGAEAITGANSSPYVWRTSFTNAQVSSAMGKYLAEQGVGPVYTLAPDYAAGQEVTKGFDSAFQSGGGTIAGQALSPFGTTQDYQPFLAPIQGSGAKATFVFYSGGEAVNFVKQYDSFGLKGSIPLYGSGFLTEGSVLEAQGQSAVGVQTTLHYSTELDNEANKKFVEAFQKAYGDLPTVFAMTTYDTANVLDQALPKADDLSGDAISKALDGLGTITDSPRGDWKFTGHTPEQHMYLREVVDQGGTLINKVVKDLGVFTQPKL